MRAMLTAHAIRYYGSAQRVALACGLGTRQAIYRWPKEVPELYQFRLHYDSSGDLKLSRRLRRKTLSSRSPALARRRLSPR
jgi:hypothetical protein